MRKEIHLIEKPYLAVHDGEIVWLETRLDDASKDYNGLAVIEGLYHRNCELYHMNWKGFGQSGDFSMKTYGKKWRVWTVDVTSPTPSSLMSAMWPKVRERSEQHV